MSYGKNRYNEQHEVINAINTKLGNASSTKVGNASSARINASKAVGNTMNLSKRSGDKELFSGMIVKKNTFLYIISIYIIKRSS